jgi:hypothetical protein
MRVCLRLFVFAALAVLSSPALAGPPYVTDDPEPTDYRHFEIYAFGGGTVTADGHGGAGGIDFNYGAAPDLQLTAVLPIEFDNPHGGPSAAGVGNLELAAKYRFLHQASTGWDVSIFPRVFLPSGSHNVGQRHASVLIPLWVGRDWGNWSTFGGGGCVINHGGDSKNYCLVAWALTNQVTPRLQLGAEIYHQTADTRGAHATTGLGIGARYDLNDHYHLLASMGPGIQHPAQTGQYSWYASLLYTF